jgi:hypothetical protein
VHPSCGGEKWKSCCDVGDSGSKKSKRGYGDVYGVSGKVCICWESGLELSGPFCIGVCSRNLVSVVVEKFSHLISFINKF